MLVAILMESMDVFSEVEYLTARQILLKAVSTTALVMDIPSQAWNSLPSVSVTPQFTMVVYCRLTKEIVTWLVLETHLRLVVQVVG